MTGDIPGSLATIEAALERLGRYALLESLRPGLPAEVVRASLDAVGLASSPELESLYGWRDGTSTTGGATLGDIWLLPGFYLLSIEDAIADHRALGSGTDSRWWPGWLPILADGGGDFYILDLGPSPASPVRRFRNEELEHPVEFDSLGALLATIAAAFERGVFFVDPDGYLEEDHPAFTGLAAELNPDVDWWRN